MIEKSDNLWYEMSDSAILATLGTFIRQTRLQRNQTQEEIATVSGIKRMTLVRIEKGSGGTMSTFIRLLRGLQQLHVLKNFQVPQTISPLLLAEQDKKKRLRAPRKKNRKKLNKKSTW